MKGLDFTSLWKICHKMGYQFFDTGKFNVNIFDNSNIYILSNTL